MEALGGDQEAYYERVLELWSSYYKCLDEDVVIYGQYDQSFFSGELELVITKCDESKYDCVSEEEQKRWLDNAYVVMKYSQTYFDQSKQGDEFMVNKAYTHSIRPTSGFKSQYRTCLLYTSPSPRDRQKTRMPSSA